MADSTSAVFFLELAQRYGISARDIAVLAGAVVLAVNWLKAEFSVTGRKLYLWVLIGSLSFAAASYLPDVGKSLIGGLVTAAAAVLGWSTAKIFRPSG